MDLYKEIKKLGIETDSHESDFYFKVTKESTDLIPGYEFYKNITVFRNQTDNTHWYCVPFAYMPYWEQKNKVTVTYSTYRKDQLSKLKEEGNELYTPKIKIQHQSSTHWIDITISELKAIEKILIGK